MYLRVEFDCIVNFLLVRIITIICFKISSLKSKVKTAALRSVPGPDAESTATVSTLSWRGNEILVELHDTLGLS